MKSCTRRALGPRRRGQRDREEAGETTQTPPSAHAIAAGNGEPSHPFPPQGGSPDRGGLLRSAEQRFLLEEKMKKRKEKRKDLGWLGIFVFRRI
jgi:hypothetical protein